MTCKAEFLCLGEKGKRVGAIGKRAYGALILAAWVLVSLTGTSSANDFEGGLGFSQPFGVSGNGAVVVGQANGSGYVPGPGIIIFNPQDSGQAYRWTLGTGAIGLGWLRPNGTDSTANGTNDDGSVIVGCSATWSFNHSGNCEAFRWTEATGMVGLGFLPGSIPTPPPGTVPVVPPGFSDATAANADGSVIAGYAENASNAVEAFRWTNAHGFDALGFLPGGLNSYATAINGDGTVVVGLSTNEPTPVPSCLACFYNNVQGEAFVWTKAKGMEGLGFLPGYTYSAAYGVSRDGTVVIGDSGSYDPYKDFPPGPEQQAFRWTRSTGMVGLGYLPGAEKSSAHAVNADGTVIVGTSGDRAFRWRAEAGMQSVQDLLVASGIDMTGWKLIDATGVSADGTAIVGYGYAPYGRSYEAWWAKVDTGFLSADVMSRSLNSMLGTGEAAQQTEAASLDSTLNIARRYGRAASPSHFSLWGGLFGGTYNVLRSDPETLAGQLGIRYQPLPALSVGVGLQLGTRTASLGAYDGRMHSAPFGIRAFAAYAPASTGPRIEAAASLDRMSDKITRGYLNGIDPAFSTGERDGKGFGGALSLEWAFGIKRARLIPFARYAASHVSLDAYTEDNGPFPVHFDKVSETLQVTRAGGELQTRVCDSLDAFASADWAHRVNARLPGLSGEVLALSVPFALDGGQVRQDWAEAGIGLDWRAQRGIVIHAEVDASSDGDTTAHYRAGLGIEVAL